MADPNRSALMDWTAEDEYWRTNYRSRPYAGSQSYDYYQPGYRYGYESAHRYRERSGMMSSRISGAAGIASNTAASARGTKSSTRCAMAGIG
jgi:hypothetical protein